MSGLLRYKRLTAVVLIFSMTSLAMLTWDYHNMAQFVHTYAEPCREKRRVAYLKVHKAGSSTLLNVLQRFGEKRQLISAIPKFGNYLGYGRTIDEDNLLKPPHETNYSLLFNHVVYNREAFRRVMPNDTIYIAIIRDPLEVMDSAMQYLVNVSRFRYIHNIPKPRLETYLKQPQKYEPKQREDSFTDNRMSYDFGMEPKYIHSEFYIRKYLKKLGDEFDLVLILEHFDESLILLKRLMCWSLEDVLYTKMNTNQKRNKPPFTEEIRKAHRRWAVADYMLYDFFEKEYYEKVKAQTKDFFEEVKFFKRVLESVAKYCKSSLNDSKNKSNLMIEKTSFSEQFTVSPHTCKLMSTHELVFMDIIRKRHLSLLKQCKGKNKCK